MKVQNLISTMNKNTKQLQNLVNELNIKESYILINQITNKDIKKTNANINESKIISVNEKGLSKSRNLALKNSCADVCILTDDDMKYEDNYIYTIKKAYKENPKADIIAFVVDNEDSKKRKKILKKGKMNYIGALRLQSVQITFKRKSVVEKNLKFDERFGTGSNFFWGEENIFLFDCIKKKLKIYYIPEKIAELPISESSWKMENIPEHFEIQGRIYCRMAPKLYLLLILQYAIRHYKTYKNEMTIKNVIKYMLIGARKFRKEKLEE